MGLSIRAGSGGGTSYCCHGGRGGLVDCPGHWKGIEVLFEILKALLIAGPIYYILEGERS